MTPHEVEFTAVTGVIMRRLVDREEIKIEPKDAP